MDRQQPACRRPWRAARGAADRRRGGGQPARPRDPARSRAGGQGAAPAAPLPDAHEPVLPDRRRSDPEHARTDLPDRREAAARARRRARRTTTVPGTGTYAWHINQSTRPFVGASGRVEAYDVTCEDAAGTVVERHALVIDRGQDVTLNLGCGNGPSTLADGTRLTGSSTRRQRLGAVGRRHSRALLPGGEARQASARQQLARRQVRRLYAPRDAPRRRRAQPVGATRVRAPLRPVVGPPRLTRRLFV